MSNAIRGTCPWRPTEYEMRDGKCLVCTDPHPNPHWDIIAAHYRASHFSEPAVSAIAIAQQKAFNDELKQKHSFEILPYEDEGDTEDVLARKENFLCNSIQKLEGLVYDIISSWNLLHRVIFLFKRLWNISRLWNNHPLEEHDLATSENKAKISDRLGGLALAVLSIPINTRVVHNVNDIKESLLIGLKALSIIGEQPIKRLHFLCGNVVGLGAALSDFGIQGEWLNQAMEKLVAERERVWEEIWRVNRTAILKLLLPVVNIEALAPNEFDRACSICLVPYGTSEIEGITPEDPVKLPCGHVAEFDCLARMFLSLGVQCPYARDLKRQDLEIEAAAYLIEIEPTESHVFTLGNIPMIDE